MTGARAPRHAGLAVGGGAVLFLGGCADGLLRETVLASTETLIGLAVSQDPKTSMYQGRLGYARHELFLVPTSKRVVRDGEGGAGSDDATGTPEVLGEIMADGDVNAPGGGAPGHVGVYQRLAVGRLAVQSGAAVALLARDAQTAVNVSAAAGERALDQLAADSAGLRFALGTDQVTWPQAADAWSLDLGFDSYDDLYARGTSADRKALARRWAAALAAAKGGAR